jgi:hypothetical protein
MYEGAGHCHSRRPVSLLNPRVHCRDPRGHSRAYAPTRVPRVLPGSGVVLDLSAPHSRGGRAYGPGQLSRTNPAGLNENRLGAAYWPLCCRWCSSLCRGRESPIPAQWRRHNRHSWVRRPMLGNLTPEGEMVRSQSFFLLLNPFSTSCRLSNPN